MQLRGPANSGSFPMNRQGSPVNTVMMWLTALVVVAAFVASSPFPHTFAQDDLGTIAPGAIHVAFTGDMPMTSLSDGKLGGTDGEMIGLIANDLGLEIIPVQMDWAAAIESVATGRVDLMLGAVGWTAERSSVMLLSDPVYYFRVHLAQKSNTSWHSLSDMAGKNVGTVTGFSLVSELKTVPDIAEIRLYDTSDAALRDLVAGRIDIAILDPPLVAMAIKEHPEWNLHQIPLDPDPHFPIMSTTYNATMGIRNDALALHDAMNAEIAELWATCTNQAIMSRYGVIGAGFFTPPDPNPRVGVDRELGWISPTLNAACDPSTGGEPPSPVLP